MSRGEVANIVVGGKNVTVGIGGSRFLNAGVVESEVGTINGGSKTEFS